MKVKRIVADLAVSDLARPKQFYQGVLGLDVLMDIGWIGPEGAPYDWLDRSRPGHRPCRSCSRRTELA
jgi:catechol 2,3-dioxygenase-like lactoylglutathione lyase family enzyme